MIKYLITFLFIVSIVHKSTCTVDDDLYDEFDEFDDESIQTTTESPKVTTNKVKKDSDSSYEDQKFDSDEFEGLEDESVVGDRTEEPQEIAKEIPIFVVKSNYYLEIGFISLIVIYIINYFIGSRKNKQLATAWATQYKDLYREQFSNVGENNAILIRESQHTYRMLCTGRANCIGLQVNLRFNRRYDIISTLYGLFSPSSDLIDIQVALNENSMDSFVFALVYSMEGRSMIKDLRDVNELAKSTKVDKLSDQFLVYSEFKDATSTILRENVKATLNKYKEYIRMIYITDQSIQNTKYKKVARFVFTLPSQDKFEDLLNVIKMTFFIIDKIKDFKLDANQRKKSIERRLNINKSERKQKLEEKQEELQKKKYENATPEQLEKWRKKDLKKRQNARMKIVH